MREFESLHLRFAVSLEITGFQGFFLYLQHPFDHNFDHNQPETGLFLLPKRSYRALDQGLHPVGSIPIHGFGDMGIDVGGEGCRGMTQVGGHLLQWHALLDRQRGKGMAHVVETAVRKTNSFRVLLEVAVYRCVVQMLSDRIGKDQVIRV